MMTMTKNEILDFLDCIDNITYENRRVDKETLMSIIDEFDDDYEEFNFEGLCFLSVLDDNELEQLEKIFEEVEFYA